MISCVFESASNKTSWNRYLCRNSSLIWANSKVRKGILIKLDRNSSISELVIWKLRQEITEIPMMDHRDLIKIPIEPLYDRNLDINEYMISCRSCMSMETFREQLELAYMNINNYLITKTQLKIGTLLEEFDNLVKFKHSRNSLLKGKK